MGGCRVRHVVLGVNAPKRDDLPNLAATDDLARELQHRVAQVAEPHHRAGAGRGRRIAHRPRGRGVHRERLFAVDRLARLDRGEGHLGVERVRGGDRHDVDVRIAGELPPVSGRPLEAERIRGAAGRRLAGVREQAKLRLEAKIEQSSHRTERVRVALPHEAGADQPDARLRLPVGHGPVPRGCGAARRAGRGAAFHRAQRTDWPGELRSFLAAGLDAARSAAWSIEGPDEHVMMPPGILGRGGGDVPGGRRMADHRYSITRGN